VAPKRRKIALRAHEAEVAEADIVKQSCRTIRIDDDFHGWLVEQAGMLRARQDRLLDWDALAEELEEMGRSERDALASNLEVVLLHMLKLGYERRETQRRWRERQWKVDLAEHRNRVNDILEASAGLRSKFDEFKTKAYARARRLAGIAIGQDQRPIGPRDCPWSRDEILDDDYFPAPLR
jgi:hypothetical protein